MFFPYYPLKIIKSINGILLISSLMGLSIILNNFFAIRITAGITISFAWLPTYIIAWYFGPIIGCFIGFLIDTLNYIIGGGVWFWLYAIQEPMLGLIVGFISSSYILFIKNKKNKIITIIIDQIIMILFFAISIFIVFYYTSENNYFFNNINSSNNDTANIIKKTNKIFRWVILAILFIYLLIIELIIIFKFKKNKINGIENFFNLQTFLNLTVTCIFTSIIFSFLLGPISSIEYYKFLHNNSNPPNLIKYGAIYYLLPRIIKECFKTPIYIILLTTIIISTNKILDTIKNKIQNSYN